MFTFLLGQALHMLDARRRMRVGHFRVLKIFSTHMEVKNGRDHGYGVLALARNDPTR
jgi:hypothetical protein